MIIFMFYLFMLTYADDIIDFGKLQMRSVFHVHMNFDIKHENKLLLTFKYTPNIL